MAGVTGPCPACGTPIQAPHPVNPVPSVAAAAAPPPAAGAPLRPEPRQKPQRPEHVETLTRPVAEVPPGTSTDSRIPRAAPMPRRSGKHWLRVLVPLFFLAASVAVMFGVMMFLKNRPDQPKDPVRPKNTERVKMILTEDDSESGQPDESAPASLPVPDPEMKDVAVDGVAPVDQTSPPPPGVVSLEVLENFLRASTLADRLPLIESRHDEGFLGGTCLAGKLQPVAAITTDVQEYNNLEKVTDVYFNVDFEMEDGAINPQTVLVRIRGEAGPKVVVDPFLDLYGGRLAQYAETPVERAQDFQVLVSAVAFCYDEHVPNREKKLTLKLLARDNTREVARAYFGRQSKIGEMLENEASGFRYGQAKAATVFLRWNDEEDPEKPFLEALMIRALDWNP